MVASDLSTLQFYADQYFDISVWRSNIALPLDFHFVQKGFWSFKLAIYTCFCNIRPWFCAKGATPRHRKTRISPHGCASDMRDLRRRLSSPNKKANFTTGSCVQCARSPHRAAVPKANSHFTARSCVRHARRGFIQHKQTWYAPTRLCVRHARSTERVTFCNLPPGYPAA